MNYGARCRWRRYPCLSASASRLFSQPVTVASVAASSRP
ncbi:MAG: hypothetical protein F2790_03520 [Actinobacteria bacterium]|nr:hypothetical protein [Actinomycetota bacterium]